MDDKRQGHWIYREGGGVEEASFVDGKLHGHYVSRYPDGSIGEEGSYVDGEKQGKWTYRGEGGFFTSEAFYLGGKAHGQWITRFSEGTTVETTFLDDKPQETVTHFSDGIVGGGSYVDGRKHGEWIEGYLARDKSKGRYVNGEKEGIWLDYDEGECSAVTYKDGVSSRTVNIERCREAGLIP